MLLLDPAPPYLRWCRLRNGGRTHDTCEFGPHWADSVLSQIGDGAGADGIGYMLYHGGEMVAEPASLLCSESLAQLAETVALLPEHNDMTLKAVEELLRRCPNVPHVLLCDTAFFAALPETASTYAVPYVLRGQGVRRYGGYGLCHQWVWEQTAARLGASLGTLVSVYLGNAPNVAAIADGHTLETTIGFTPVEGMPSATGCGDIDPTIVLHLHAAGMSFEELNDMLSRKSGFTALVGRPCGPVDLLRNEDDKATHTAREILRFHLTKQLGAAISVLGGMDALAFVTGDPEACVPFISATCENLGFMGLRCSTAPRRQGDAWVLSEDGSPVHALCYPYDKWGIMAQRAATLLRSR